MDEAAPWRVLRKAGAAAKNALYIAVAMAPIGETVFEIVSEALIVATTKLRKAVFHW